METPSLKHVQIQLIDSGRIAMVKYDRPRSGNSLHPELLAGMVAALKWADKHPNVRIIIQTGTGKFFNTGMDLIDGDNMSFAKGSNFHKLNKILILSEKILIAAVNGPGVGYGASSLALFDLVFSVPDAYFFTPFVKWGMAAEGASSFSFPRLMGHQKTAKLFLAGERITAQEAEKLGLVSMILQKDNFLGRVTEIAQKIALSPPGSLRATKRLMKAPVLQDLLDANDRECTLIHSDRYGFQENMDAIQQFRVERNKRKAQVNKL